jgi:hypothetical protein
METQDRSATLAWMVGAVEMMGACGVADFLRWFLYGVKLDVFVGENSTGCLPGEATHAVGNDVETHLIAILVMLLQDSSAQRFVGRRFQRGEENEFVELLFSQLFELEPLHGRFSSIG